MGRVDSKFTLLDGAVRGTRLIDASRRTVTGAVPPSSVDPINTMVFAARAFALTIVPLLLWFGFVNHTSSERTVRRIFQQIASIALLVTSGMVLLGGVLAFYELRSR